MLCVPGIDYEEMIMRTNGKQQLEKISKGIFILTNGAASNSNVNSSFIALPAASEFQRKGHQESCKRLL